MTTGRGRYCVLNRRNAGAVYRAPGDSSTATKTATISGRRGVCGARAPYGLGGGGGVMMSSTVEEPVTVSPLTTSVAVTTKTTGVSCCTLR